MNSDLPELLRGYAKMIPANPALINGPSILLAREAASEIERLQDENTKLREAVETLSTELTAEAGSMMRQPEADVIRSIAERLHSVVFRRQRRDKL